MHLRKNTFIERNKVNLFKQINKRFKNELTLNKYFSYN